ncbi:aldo/keto reductase [Paenibacillus curdlanolyticus YK9]|uniref:Aldo/keto reductase n=1 Tax=Paenibacillus curdlanolyticus YK9 TaxID=717606 RepID=E0IA43_9BACL|nr:aldo/keto reductase [Paenibacillus curdlanolyticus]EFM10620.1 aldo/keto reductase [Paenibacillus curdlanolyticus YK9]
MKQRQYGTTGKQVSEIGFGAWQLGNQQDWEAMGDEDAIKLVHAALERGVNFFDTAPNYGLGRSETLLGIALANRRSRAVINTKFGHAADGTTNYDPSSIRTSVEQSLRRLRTDYVDSVLIHNPPFDHLDGKLGNFDIFSQLKQEGKLLAYGASVDSSKEMLELIQHTDVGVIEVLFNIFAQETAEAFQLAKEKKIALIVKIPLDSGWLSGKYDAQSTFEGVRSRWSRETIAKRAALVERIRFISDEQTTMTTAALRFILAYPEIATVIPGVRNIAQLDENAAASDAQMPHEHVRKLQELWDKEIRFQNLGW